MRKLTFQLDHYYHLFNRGVNRRPIFFQAENWAFFLRRLRHYCHPDLVEVISYCLMPTHYHLLVRLKTDQLIDKSSRIRTIAGEARVSLSLSKATLAALTGRALLEIALRRAQGDFSLGAIVRSLTAFYISQRIKQPLSVSYTKAINRQQNRVGPLFQGPFRARLVDKDSYLTHLSRCIHLNPVAAGLAARPHDWVYSSYRDTIGLRRGTLPRPAAVLDQFPSTAAYRESWKGLTTAASR